MSKAQEEFLIAAEKKSFDKAHYNTIRYNIAQYDKKVVEGKEQFSNLELAKTRAAAIKQKSIDNLEKYLIEFEANFIRRGGKVIWAQDSEEAVKEALQIMKRVNAKTVVKAKSMTTEEVDLNEQLEKQGIESIETDLGEYIVQLRKEPPYHIVTPAMHLSKEEVAKTFEEKKGTAANLSPEQITHFVRMELRARYNKAEVGVSGANFLIADAGAIAVTENEGNGLMSSAFPKVQIVIVGIEKVIPSLADLDLFWPLLSTYGTGQQLTAYNTIYSGPKQQGETDGPDEMIVILLDNGRTTLLAETEQRRALSCIRCGACLNACPVYQTVGGHAYGTTYSGPIGSIITPHFKGFEEFKHLSYASTLCGKCTEVCPVKIDIHKLLLLNRKQSIDKKISTKTENWVWFFWKGAMLKRSKMDKGGAKIKNFMIKQFFKKQWGERRELPEVTPKSFNQIWKERKGLK
ncbi:MAG: LutB/LldF family L-lactate oxidation iron-sulfur protein [Bacteroidota bacterium]|nr:LutB/LldF family L-lactate oxidation iron-sulfur protein [Bacteroidota bacterium]